MRWFAVLMLVSGCGATAELKAWQARLAERQARHARLVQLKADRGAQAHSFEASRSAWAARMRDFNLLEALRALHPEGVQALPTEAGVRLVFQGDAETCLARVQQLAPVRWLTGRWRLRLEQGQCLWEAWVHPDVVAAQQALRPPWFAPPTEGWRWGLSRTREQVETLDAAIAALEAELGPLAMVDDMQAQVLTLDTLSARLHAAPAPCDVEVLARAISSAEPGRLEISSDKLVEPLEPLGDARLKGLVSVGGGGLQWSCPTGQ